MNSQLYAFYFVLSLVAVVKITSSTINATKNENNLVTTRNEYILKHILRSYKSNDIIEQEVKIDNKNIELIKNDSISQQQQKDDDESLYDYEYYEQPKPKTFVDLYHEGVTAYLSNDWIGCISLLERAIVLYQDYYNTLTYCRVSCDMDGTHIKSKFEENYENHHFYEGMLHKTLCVEKCRREQLHGVPQFFTIDYDDKVVFKTRQPYNYLQVCYHKDREIKKAINAAFTALIGNPDDKMLKKNIEYYATLKDFDYEIMKDLEDKEFSKFYSQGVAAYNQKNWTETIDNFEKFIQLWIQEYDKCRAFCEDDYHQGWLPDFTVALANHYVYTLRCKQNCTSDLNNISGRKYDDAFANSYDYLQFSYYQIGEIKKGAQCVSSYLLLYIDSTDMLDSLKYYKNLPNVTDDYFQPREEAKRLGAIRKYEKYILEFVDREFSKLYADDEKNFQESTTSSDLSEAQMAGKENERVHNVEKDEGLNFSKLIKKFINKWKTNGNKV